MLKHAACIRLVCAVIVFHEPRIKHFLSEWVQGARAPEPGTLQSSFHPGMELEDQSTVVLLGMPGAGKSSLGNLLVFGDVYSEEGFEIGSRADSMTAQCEPKTRFFDKCQLTVYNTPGVPDTDRANTCNQFDKIVKMIRGLASLNAIVFLIKCDRQEERDDGAFRMLLRQFSKLPCRIVMLCRVDTTDCGHRWEEQARKEKGAFELIKRVIDKSELGRDRVQTFLLHHGDQGKNDVDLLRWHLCTMPGVAVAQETLLTTGEMADVHKDLSNKKTRIEALYKERHNLEESLEKVDEEIVKLQNRIRIWQVPQIGLGIIGQVSGVPTTIVACTDIYTLGSMTLVFSGTKIVGNVAELIVLAQIAWWKGALEIARTNRARLDKEIGQRRQEIDTGKVDPQRLKVACEELEELKKLLDR